MIKSKASGFKKYLKEYVIIEDKSLYMVNILDYFYINAVSMELVDLVNKKFSQAYLYATISSKFNLY